LAALLLTYKEYYGFKSQSVPFQVFRKLNTTISAGCADDSVSEMIHKKACTTLAKNKPDYSFYFIQDETLDLTTLPLLVISNVNCRSINVIG